VSFYQVIYYSMRQVKIGRNRPISLTIDRAKIAITDMTLNLDNPVGLG
jgi:hypothetical protein